MGSSDITTSLYFDMNTSCITVVILMGINLNQADWHNCSKNNYEHLKITSECITFMCSHKHKGFLCVIFNGSIEI